MGEFFHHVGELGEEVMRIMWAGGSFRVVLDAEERQVLVAHTFVGVVVQIQMRDFDIAGGQRFRIDAETMILGGDFHLIGKEVFHGMIGTVMTELQFKGFSAERDAAELMAETNAEDRDAAGKLSDAFLRVGNGLRIAGAIRKEHTIRAEGEDVFCGSFRRDDSDFAVMIDEQTQNVLLDAKIVGDHFEFATVGSRTRFAHLLRPRRGSELDGPLLPIVGFAARNAAGKLLPGHQGELLGFEHELVGRRAIGGDHAAKRTNLADVKHQGARIDVPDNGNFVAIEIELRAFAGTIVGSNLREFADDQGFDVRMRSLFIIEIRAHVADMGIREAHNLPGITGVRKNFLVSGEAGIKNNFAAAARDSAGRAAVKYAPVFERENGRSGLNVRQWILRLTSFVIGLGCGQGTEVIHGPVREHSSTVNELAGDRSEDP